MKILLINVTYKKGSTGNLVCSFKQEFEKLGYEAYVAYGRGDKIKENNVFKCCYELESKFHHFMSLFTGNMYGGMFLSTLKIKKLINKIKPDVVHLHCLNGYFVNIYKLLNYLKKKNIRTVLTHHADFMFTGGCGYSDECLGYLNECKKCKRVSYINGKFSVNRMHKNYLKMNNCIKNFTNLTCTGVSPWLTNRIAESPIYKNTRTKTVLNCINDNFAKSISDKNPFDKFDLKNKKVIFTVISDFYDYIKGGQYIGKLSKLIDNEKYIICVAGAEGPKLENVIYLGKIANDQLSNYYHYAFVTILLSKRETFSMIVAESLVSGTPVIGFKSGGPESIAIEDYSCFCDYGNIESLYDAIECLGSINKSELAEKAKSKYSTKNVSMEYIRIYEAN